MKLNGIVIEGPTPEVIVIPKGDKEFVFKAMPVLSYKEFEGLCPVPLPPEKTFPGGERKVLYNDKDYRAKLNAWSGHKSSWMIIESLKASEGLEWDTIDMSDPATWGNYETELGLNFTESEIGLVVEIVFIANGLNQEKIDKATKRFLAGPAEELSEQ